LNSSARLNGTLERVAPSLEFLPDAMVLEAEWRTNPALAQQLEEDRAQQSSRAPGAIFLRQARFALMLRKLIREKNVSHIHATSSRALVCALMLKKVLGVTVSATIEPRSKLSREWIQNALSECVGGRLSSRKFVEQRGGAFFLDKTTFRSAPRKTLGQITQKTHIDLTTGSRFGQWANCFALSGSERKSKSKIQMKKPFCSWAVRGHVYPLTRSCANGATDLRQADDLLPAGDADAGRLREVLIISTPKICHAQHYLGDGTQL
jgi:hypothetical protein